MQDMNAGNGDAPLARAVADGTVRHTAAREGVQHAETFTDDELLRLYEWWSEDRYAATFMHPFRDVVEAFVNWLGSEEGRAQRGRRVATADYEREMLRIARELLP